MKLKSTILTFLIVYSIMTLVYPDELKTQEPIAEYEKIEGAYKTLGLDLRDSKEFMTENYIFLLNFENNHTAVFHRHSKYLFVGVDIHSAYYIVCKEVEGVETWRMYQVEKLNRESSITKLFFKMEKEWLDYTAKGCPGLKKERADKICM